MSDASEALTAALAGGIAEDLVAQGHGEAPAQPVAAPPPAASQPVETPAAPAAQGEEEVPTFDFQPKLSDELRDLLDEPDFDEEAALEVASEFEENDDYEYDPEVAKKLKALEKRNAYLEQRVVDSNKKKWIAENLNAYPLLKNYAPDELKALNATSRRAFARSAAALNARYEKALGPALAEINKAKEAIGAGAVEVARKEVAEAWGQPASDSLPPADVARQQALEEARKKGGLLGALKVLIQ